MLNVRLIGLILCLDLLFSVGLYCSVLSTRRCLFQSLVHRPMAVIVMPLWFNSLNV